MKKRIVAALTALILALTLGCGSTMVRNGYEYDTVGVLTGKNPRVEYRIIWGNVILGGVLISTIIAPVYFWGFSMEEPVALWDDYMDDDWRLGSARGFSVDNETVPEYSLPYRINDNPAWWEYGQCVDSDVVGECR